MMSRDHVKDDLGAFVLGALEPAEEERVRSHLADCDQCRREHDRLAAVAPALALLQRPREARASLPPVLDEEVMRGLARERGMPARASGPGRRDVLAHLVGRSAVAGALVGCAATIVILAIGGAFSGEALPTQTVDLSSPGSPARASARLAPVARAARSACGPADCPRRRRARSTRSGSYAGTPA